MQCSCFSGRSQRIWEWGRPHGAQTSGLLRWPFNSWSSCLHPTPSAGIAGYTTAPSRKTILFLTRRSLAPESSLTSRPVTAPMVRSCSPNDAHFKPVSFLACSSLSATTKPPFPFPLITPGCSHFLSIFNNVGIFNWRKMLNYLFNVAEEVSGPHGVGTGARAGLSVNKGRWNWRSPKVSLLVESVLTDRLTVM